MSAVTFSTEHVADSDLLIVQITHHDGSCTELLISAREMDGLCVSIDASRSVRANVNVNSVDVFSHGDWDE